MILFFIGLVWSSSSSGQHRLTDVRLIYRDFQGVPSISVTIDLKLNSDTVTVKKQEIFPDGIPPSIRSPLDTLNNVIRRPSRVRLCDRDMYINGKVLADTSFLLSANDYEQIETAIDKIFWHDSKCYPSGLERELSSYELRIGPNGITLKGLVWTPDYNPKERGLLQFYQAC